jgi:Cu(I)/Ag(I) efflux system membrane fusion protein
LYHRLYADGIVKAEVPEVLALPRSAVVSPGPQAVAYVDQGSGQYEQRPLKLGRLGDDFWEILDGVAAGEKVVISGNMLIDAQAQLNQSAHATTPSESTNDSTAVPHEHSTAIGRGAVKPAAESAVSLDKLTEPQEEAVREFLTVASDIAHALASDSVEQFNQRAPKLHTVATALLQAVADSPAWQPLVQKLNATGHLQPAVDLPAARKAFLPFSAATAEFAGKLRAQQAGFASLKIYQCPMVNRAIPGAPKIGQWIQTEAPLRNPFFGADMLSCGSEVKP